MPFTKAKYEMTGVFLIDKNCFMNQDDRGNMELWKAR